MELNLKSLVSNGKRAKCIGIRVGASVSTTHLDFVTDDGFRFNVPMHEIMPNGFPLEGKAIEYMRWIRKALQALAAEELAKQEDEILSVPNPFSEG